MVTYEKLLTELEQSLACLPALVAGLPPEQAEQRPGADQWSVLEVVCHMIDVEVLDFRAHTRQALDGETWSDYDPFGAIEQGVYAGRQLETETGRWVKERQTSLAWLRGLGQANWQAEISAPWGSFTAAKLLENWAAHDAHHLRQLVELKYARVAAMGDGDLRYAGDW